MSTILTRTLIVTTALSVLVPAGAVAHRYEVARDHDERASAVSAMDALYTDAEQARVDQWRATTDGLRERALEVAEGDGLPAPTSADPAEIVAETMLTLDPAGVIDVRWDCEDVGGDIVGIVHQDDPTWLCLSTSLLASLPAEEIQETVAHEYAHLVQAWTWTDDDGSVQVAEQVKALDAEVGTTTAFGDQERGGVEIQADCLADLLGAKAGHSYAPEGCSPAAEASAWRVLNGER